MNKFDPRRLLTPLALSLSLCASLAPMHASAAPPRVTGPQISNFEMEPIDKVAPGAELFFRVQGTPNSRATVKVAGVARTLVLTEVDDGVYEGAYTLRPGDAVSPNSGATVTLKRSERTATQTMGRLTAANAITARPAPPPPVAAGPAPVINRFSVRSIDRIEPGTELRFMAEGTPGARASFEIENVARGVPMREVNPGHYEGVYTIKRTDRISEGMPIVATLEANGQAVRSELNRRGALVDARPPSIRNVQPREGDVVRATGPVSVTGTFDDRGGVGVDPSSVRVVVGGRDVTSSTSITRDFFTYRSELAPGRYVADVTARDNAGNPVRQTWSFSVEQQPTAAVGLPLEITSHAANATVAPGRLVVRGKSAPYATVDAEVTGVASVAGMIGVSHKLYSDRVTADANGNFSFSFQPQVQVPGMRYEVEMRATSGSTTRESKLVLFQQR